MGYGGKLPHIHDLSMV